MSMRLYTCMHVPYIACIRTVVSESKALAFERSPASCMIRMHNVCIAKQCESYNDTCECMLRMQRLLCMLRMLLTFGKRRAYC